jgi:hypothetical protein
VNDLPLRTRICLFVGRFGSGKTEIALNYALWLAEWGRRTEGQAAGAEVDRASQPSDQTAPRRPILVDLDIVTPYFRSREMAERMAACGVEVVAPAAVAQHLDIPAITPQIAGALQQPDRPVVLDAGGDEQGARALGQFSPALTAQGYGMYFVVNPYRPFTDAASGVRRAMTLIQATSRLQATALVSNPNLMAETTPAHVMRGHAQVEAMAEELGLPVVLVGVDRRLRTSLGENHFELPVLWLDRHFVLPWEA